MVTYKHYVESAVKSDKKLWDICMNMYCEMYQKSNPPADFRKLIETGEAKRDNFFRNYYLPQDQYEEIFERHCKENKLTKRERHKVAFTVHLGASPTSVKPQEWDDEEN